MKGFIAILAFIFISLPAQSATVFQATDGDVDSLIIEGSLVPGQFLALTQPNTLPGLFLSLSLANLFDHDQKVEIDIPVILSPTRNFSVALWDVGWKFADNVTFLGSGDAAILEWYTGPEDQHTTLKMLAVDVGLVSLPASVWLFSSSLLGVIGIARRKRI